jgi:hypothetical protein
MNEYKCHLISSAGVLDEFSRSYAPVASINWATEDGKPDAQVFDNSPRRFLTQEEAAEFALSEAQKWIDEHIENSD